MNGTTPQAGRKHYPKYVLRLFRLLATDSAFIKRTIAEDNYTLFYYRADTLRHEVVSHITIDENRELFDEQHFWHFIPPMSKLTLNERGHAVLSANTPK